jgi:hypothetical protein
MMAPHFSQGTGFHCVESITPLATIRTHHRPTRTVVANGKTRKYRTISELDKGREVSNGLLIVRITLSTTRASAAQDQELIASASRKRRELS